MGAVCVGGGGGAKDDGDRPILGRGISTKFDRSAFILDQDGGVIEDYYKIGVQLGEGNYGKVVLGEETGKKVYKAKKGSKRAIKIINKRNVKGKSVERFKTEVKVMKEIDHPNIVRLYESFEDKHDVFLILELCEGGELFERIQDENKFSEKAAAHLMSQILKMVAYIHDMGIMHRDIKPENFMFYERQQALEKSTLKLIDFGLSKRFVKGELQSTRVGTAYYVSPEVLNGRYDEKCDVWSCGIIMYIMLCGYPPFYGQSDQETIEKVQEGSLDFNDAVWKNVSKDAVSLINRLLDTEGGRRIPALKAVEDAWIKNMAPAAKNVPLTADVFQRMRSYKNRNKLQKATLSIIAQRLDHKEIEDLRALWRSLDTDNSGRVSMKELKAGAKQLAAKSGKKEIDKDLEDLFDRLDQDGSGQIDYTEFLASTIDKKIYAQDEVLWSAFRIFDKDGNGSISREELDMVLHDDNVTAQYMAETIDRVMKETDTNGDGEIDFDEFRELITKMDQK